MYIEPNVTHVAAKGQQIVMRAPYGAARWHAAANAVMRYRRYARAAMQACIGEEIKMSDNVSCASCHAAQCTTEIRYNQVRVRKPFQSCPSSQNHKGLGTTHRRPPSLKRCRQKSTVCPSVRPVPLPLPLQVAHYPFACPVLSKCVHGEK